MLLHLKNGQFVHYSELLIYSIMQPNVVFLSPINILILISTRLPSTTYLYPHFSVLNLLLTPPSSTKRTKMTSMMEYLNQFPGHMRPDVVGDMKWEKWDALMMYPSLWIVESPSG